MNLRTGDVLARNRSVLLLALVTAAILTVPLVATLLSDEVAWTLPDFLAAGALVFGAGLALVWSARHVRRYRVLLSVAVLGVFVLIWAELAVGVYTDLGG